MADATFLIEIIVKARRELAGAMEKAARDIDKVTGAEERHAKATKKVVEATNTSKQAVDDLTKNYGDYVDALERGDRSSKDAIAQLKLFSAEFDKLSKRATAGSEVADSLLAAGRRAKELAAQLEQANKDQLAAEKRLAADKAKIQANAEAGLTKAQDVVRKERERREKESNAKITKEIEQAYKERDQVDAAYTQLAENRANARKSLVLELLAEVARDEKVRAKQREEIARHEDAEAIRRQDGRVASIRAADEEIEKEAERSAKAREKIEESIATARRKLQTDSIAAQGQERLANLQREQGQKNLRQEIEDTIRSYDDFIDRVRRGEVSGRAVKTGLVQHAQALSTGSRRAVGSFGPASQESLQIGGREVEARDIIRDIGRESSSAEPRVLGFTSALQRMLKIDPKNLESLRNSISDTEDKLGKASFQAIHFAGVLRSLVYVGAIVFFQELTSAAIALAGALVAVASTAVQAGGAIVGALAAGAAQALPIIGLLGAAWGRVGAIFKAVQQNIKQTAQANSDATVSANRQRDAAQRQADAADRLKKAHEALAPAYAEARRRIEDLTSAQRDAELQARRSILSQGAAQVALTSALRSGDVGSVADLSLRVDESNATADQARTGLFRATADARSAVAGGPSKQPGVVAAAEAIRQARRDLNAAKLDAQDAISKVSTADRLLQQMLADMSPAERALYEVLNRVVARYRKVFTGDGGILESITTAFTFGAERVLDLLSDNRLLEAARNLSDAIGGTLRRIFSELSGGGSRSFLADLADDARRNLPLVTELAIQIGRIAGYIVKAGGPALTRFLDFFVTLATRGAQATGSQSGLSKLEAFFLKGEQYAENITMLALAVTDLFAAILGQAAPEGQNAIESITENIRKATEYINDNKDAVRQFFEDAVDATGAIASALGKLAIGLFGFFKSDQVKTFADAFTKTFLPALISILKVVGVLSNAFLRFAGSGPGSILLQFLLVTVGIVKVVGPLVALLARLGRAVGLLLGMGKVVGFFNRFLFLLGPIGIAVGLVLSALILLNGKFHFIDKFRDLFTSAADKAREAGDKLTESINKQIEAMRRQRDAALALQGSRLSRARAEVAVEASQRDAKRVGGIDLQTGRIEPGFKVTDERRDASINLKQALLDEKQAAIDLTDARKKDREEKQKNVTQGKDTVNDAKKRVGALKDERTEIEKRIDAAKREIDFQKKLLDQQVPGTRDYRISQEQLKDAQNKLKDAQSDLRGNTKNLRLEADRGRLAFDRWRNAVRKAGSNTETFSDDVHAAMDSVVSDVNSVLVEFGAKPLKWKSTRKKTKVESGDATAQLRPGDTGLGGFQRGGVTPGIIPGTGDGDKVHVMAEPGEGFINKAATAWLGGKRAIDAINSMVPRFARGGIVQIPGKFGGGQGIDSRILNDVVSLITRFKALVTAGYAPSGHAAGGEHPLGLAIDVVPGPGGSWDRIGEFAKWAEPQQNHPRNPFRWVGWTGDAGHGPPSEAGANAHLHLSWLHDGLKAVETLKGAAGLAFDVVKRQVSGPKGALTDLFQGASDKVVKAANDYLSKKTDSSQFTGGAAGSGSTVLLGEGGPGRRIFDYFIARGFSKNQAAAWVGNFVQESALDSSAVQPGGPGRGLGQWGDERFTALQAFAKDRGTTWQDEQTQLDFVWHELTGSEKAAYRKIKAAKTLEAAVAAIGQSYERFGVEGNRIGPAQDALKAYGGGQAKGVGHFAAGGEVDGPAGKAVQIVAHAKEWVVNQSQQGKLAGLVGTSVSGLRSMLGFSGGPDSFVGGGEVEFKASRTAARAAHAQAVAEAVTNRPTLGITGDIRVILGEVNKASSIIAGLKSSLINSKFTDKLSLAIKQMAGDGGLLDILSTSISDFSDRLGVNLGKLAFKFDKAGNIVQGLTPGQTASKSLDNLQRVYAALIGEKGAIQRQISDVVERLKSSKLGSGERALLESTKTNLDKRLQDVQVAINQSLSDQFQGVENIIQTSVDAAQTQHDDSTFRSGIQGRLRALAGQDLSSILGLPSPGQLAKIQANALNVQANNVANAARTAQRAGHTDTAKALLKTVDDLRVQALEIVAQGIRDDVANVEARASRRDARIALSGRAADLMERVGNTAGAFASRGSNLAATGSSLSTQATELQGLLAQANATGNGALVEELTAKIEELEQSIAENTVAVGENTTAARNAAIAAITDRGSNLGGIFSGVAGIFTALGQITGITDTSKLASILKQAGVVLVQTGRGLMDKLFENFGIDLRGLDPTGVGNALLGLDFDKITANLSPGDKTQFWALINSIIGNTTATLNNTNELNNLTSPTSQTFESTAWKTFRRAIFNGAGGLLPQFDMSVPSLAIGGDIMRGGLVNVHSGERVVAATVVKSSNTNAGGDTINVAVTHPVEQFDYTDGARQMAYEFKKKKGGGN